MDTSAPRINQVQLTVREIVWSLPSASCDRCDTPSERVWDAERIAIDIDLDYPVLLLVHVSVHHCLSCDHYFRVQPPFLRPDATYANRVVSKAIQSVYDDGMAILRVTQRLARDFWVRPSEAIIRVWCRGYSQGLTLEGEYQKWVVGEFSGVLCVDEVYQGRIALLLAVDSAGPSGDRIVGYQLLQDKVEKEDVENFLLRLKQAGVELEEVVTDDSALYPGVIAKVWPMAVHQLCLFHETRAVTKAVLQVVKEVRKELPKPPVIKRWNGRPKRGASGESASGDITEYDRRACIAEVHRLRKEGYGVRAITRRTGHSRNTIRQWLKLPEDEAQDIAEVVKSDAADSDSSVSQNLEDKEQSAPKQPPAPWQSWDEVRQFSQTLLQDRYLFVHRPENLTDDEPERLAELLSKPCAEKLRLRSGIASGVTNKVEDATPRMLGSVIKPGGRKRNTRAWRR